MRNPIPPPPRKGWCSVCERLSPADREEARRLRFAEGWGYQRLAKRYRCSRSSMHRHFRGSHNAASRPFEYNARANYERERMERERKP